MPSPSDLDQLLAEGRAFRERGAPVRAGRRATDALVSESDAGPGPATVSYATEDLLVAGIEAPSARGIPYHAAPVATGPVAASSLQAAWIDPEEMPFTPVPKPGNTFTARVFSLFVMAAFLGVLSWLIIPEVSFRIRTADTVTLDDGILTAQAVPLAPIRPAKVDEVYVSAAELRDSVLPAGTPIARLESMTTDGQSIETYDLSVPFDARFVSIDTLVGAVTLPGTPVATVFDPEAMYVIAAVQPSILDSLRRGMQVELRSEVLDETIAGELISAVPLLGTEHEPTTSELVNVRIRPDAEAMADLVPGIRFEARIDLTSAPADAPPIVFTDADHVMPGSSDG